MYLELTLKEIPQAIVHRAWDTAGLLVSPKGLKGYLNTALGEFEVVFHLYPLKIQIQW